MIKKLKPYFGFILFIFVNIFLLTNCEYIADKVLGSIFYAHRTKYTKDWSDYSWEKIKKGETEKRVKELIGEPFYIKEDKEGKRHFTYTKSASSSGRYFKKILVFDLENKVEKKIETHYLD